MGGGIVRLVFVVWGSWGCWLWGVGGLSFGALLLGIIIVGEVFLWRFLTMGMEMELWSGERRARRGFLVNRLGNLGWSLPETSVSDEHQTISPEVLCSTALSSKFVLTTCSPPSNFVQIPFHGLSPLQRLCQNSRRPLSVIKMAVHAGACATPYVRLELPIVN